jgi:type IV pilus assembly protein PilE
MEFDMATDSAKVSVSSSGFTLIELMMTVAILAIIASVALPSYVKHVQKGRRTEAKTALLDLAGREERLYSTTNAYSSVPSDLGYSGTTLPFTVGSGSYQVNITGTPTGFTLTATAVGSQTNDTQCRSFMVNQLGQQTATNSSAVDSTSACW